MGCSKSSAQKCPLPVGILCPTRVDVAKLIGSKEVVQELVALALPAVSAEEDADPGNHALKEEDGQGPDECQGDSLEVRQAAAALALVSTASCTRWQVSQFALLIVDDDPCFMACRSRENKAAYELPFRIADMDKSQKTRKGDDRLQACVTCAASSGRYQHRARASDIEM